MSWSLSVPKQENAGEFYKALWGAKETPKADKRTKAGKAQDKHVYIAKEALEFIAEATGALSGSASGHVAPDLSGNISVSAGIPVP